MVKIMLYSAWMLAGVELIQAITSYSLRHIVERLITVKGILNKELAGFLRYVP
jgi:hypothetical protein